MTKSRSPIRRSFVTAAGVLLAVLSAAVVLPGTANAATTAPAKANPITHPRLDWMGSTIAAHEHTTKGAHLVIPMVDQTPGMDVSAYQGDVDWATAYANGARFAYVKATESTDYTNPDFAQQYNGSYDAGIIRGAYHFATPNTSSGAAQADYFVDNGGGWSADGMTLPPMLDIEYNPYGDECYDLSQGDMVNWINDFSNEVAARTGRYPTIYTTTDWWTTCTGNAGGYAANNPLFIARYASDPGALPGDWGYYTFWQYADSGTFPGDQDYFNGPLSGLQALAG
jgi:GH25 family lysozyme M1 (1,4-beta-N-acetylmuramidase)